MSHICCVPAAHLCCPVLWSYCCTIARRLGHSKIEALQEPAQVHSIGPPERQQLDVRAASDNAGRHLTQRQLAKWHAILCA